jgi:hypothetical protein
MIHSNCNLFFIKIFKLYNIFKTLLILNIIWFQNYYKCVYKTLSIEISIDTSLILSKKINRC